MYKTSCRRPLTRKERETKEINAKKCKTTLNVRRSLACATWLTEDEATCPWRHQGATGGAELRRQWGPGPQARRWGSRVEEAAGAEEEASALFVIEVGTGAEDEAASGSEDETTVRTAEGARGMGFAARELRFFRWLSQ